MGINESGLTGDESGSGYVNVQGQGTPGTPDGGVITVQGIAGATPLPNNLTQVGGVTLSGANVVDAINGAWKVNVVAGGAGGGLSQLQVRNASNVWTDVGYFGGNLTLPISATTLPLPTGAATSANQSTEITSLQLIDNLPNLEGTSIVGASGVGVLGSDGSNLRWLKVDASGNLIVATAPSPNTYFRFGYVATSVIAIREVTSTVYTEQTTNAQRSIASASANDTAAGTGARQVKITYLNQTGAGPFTETITLNGTTYVNTVNTNICFIEKMEVTSVGSTGSNVGIITLKAATAGGGATIWTMAATQNDTFAAHHYVPTGMVMKVTGISCSHNGTTVGSGALYFLRAKTIGVANAVNVQISDFVRLYGQSSTFSRVYNSPISVTGPSRVVMYATPESASSFTYRGSFDFNEQ